MSEANQHPVVNDPKGWAKACAEADKLMEPIDKQLNPLVKRIDRIIHSLTDAGYLKERG